MVDASGKGNHGAITEAARTTSGKAGQALYFDGVNDWVTVKDSASLDLGKRHDFGSMGLSKRNNE
ncbi:MAG: hypothetical protein IPK63_22075 [Candidatus Competibacteraceae bacterium]|nr:hypothetical protein [Candidatus Competibacteraceae bacterium]